MKRNKFKKMKLEIQTLEPVSHPDNCVLLLSEVKMENPEPMELSIGQAMQKKSWMPDGTILVGLEAKGIRTEDEKMRDLGTSKQAEILDYNFFRSRLPKTVVTEVKAELLDFRLRKTIPFSVKKLEFAFGNGKKVDYTDKVSVLSLNQLAS